MWLCNCYEDKLWKHPTISFICFSWEMQVSVTFKDVHRPSIMFLFSPPPPLCTCRQQNSYGFYFRPYMCMYAGSTITKEKIDSLWIGLEFCAVCGKQSWVQWCPFSDTLGMFLMCSRDGQWAHCGHPIWNSPHESFFNLSQFITLPLWHKKLN